MRSARAGNKFVMLMVVCATLVNLPTGLAQADTDGFAENLLKETALQANKLPSPSQCLILAQVAVEYQRRGQNAKAEALWSKVDTMVQSCNDKDERNEMLTAAAVHQARSGNLEKTKDRLLEIEDVQVRHLAIMQIAIALCDQSKFKVALDLAESMPRESRVLFDTMEQIGLAAAASGETVLAARASRGMNPGLGGSMARKLRTVSKMCRSYWKTGNKKSAIAFMAQGKKFSDIMKLDLKSTLIVNSTWAGLQAEDFELELTRMLAELSKTETDADKEEIRISLAYVVLDFDRPNLIKLFHGNNDGKSYRGILDVLLANHLAESGKTTEALKAIEAIRVPLLAADSYVKLAKFFVDNDNLDEARKYLDLAKPILVNFVALENKPAGSWWVLNDYVQASASTGQHVDALALVKQLSNPAKVAEFEVRIVQAMK